MKAAPFAYQRPGDTAEALALLGQLENARLLAGGQSLVSMLNLRYAIVDHVIDLNRVAGLTGIECGAEQATIRAMTRQHVILDHPELRERAPIFAAALRYVGHLQTRNRGTLGGSLAQMDPAAELMGIASLLDAEIHVESQRGARDIAIADFSAGYMTPSLEPDEMITAVAFRLPAAGHGWGFQEFAQRHGDFAIVGVAAILEGTVERITGARIALIGIGAAPRRVAEAEALLCGAPLTADAIAAAAEAARRIETMEDAMVSAAYRQRLAGVLTRRALAEAAARLKGS